MFFASLLALIPLLSTSVSAAPTERQNGLTVVSNCYQNGQVALTFDGECFLPLVPRHTELELML